MTIELHVSDEVPALLERIDDIYALLQAEASDGERLRRPTPAVQQALKDTGIFRLMIPAELGGYEATPTQVLEVMEKLSHADASLSWLVRALAGETAVAATYLGDDAIAELFVDGSHPLVAGQSVAFTGEATSEDGGYRVSGKWQFAPGLSMATHVNVAVTVDGTGECLVCLVPRDDLLLTDNWETLGLRATASMDYEAKDVFVPERFTFRTGPDAVRRGGHLNRLGPALLAGLHQSAWSQGVGRRMLDELRALAVRRAQGGQTGVSALTSDEFFHDFARHYSHVRGTMALLRETWNSHETALKAGQELDDMQETMSRLASNLATRTALEIAELTVHRYAGAQVLRNGTLQRLFRDSHAGTQHRGTSVTVTQQCGRMLTGVLPEGSHWGFFDLVVPEGETA